MRVLKQAAAPRRPPRRRSRSRAASRRPRARKSSAARRGRSRGRAAELPPAARPARPRRARGRRWSTPNFRSRTSSTSSRPPSREAIRARGVSAFVTVQEGCDKFCTFCVVPYTRGAEMSRPVAKIVAEVARLADAGVREVTLIGQNVNAYHGEGPDGRAWTLGRLLHRLAEVPGIARLRYTTSHPCDMDESLIAAHRDLPALMPLPASAGAVGIRPHSRGHEPPAHAATDYLDAIARVRAARPDMAFSSDFIVGFPGESEDDFRATLSLVDEVGYASAFSFKYSPRPGTPAADMAEQSSRRGEIRAAAASAGRDRPPAARLQRAMSSAAPSMFCSRSRDAILASSPAAPHISSRCRSWLPQTMIGEIAAVTITELSANSLFGALAGESRGRRTDARGSGGLTALRSPRTGQRRRSSPSPSTVAATTPRPRSCSPSTTTGSPRCCSASTARTSR